MIQKPLQLPTKIINILGGPGVGKSTTAAGIFYEMKRMDINCELVSEFPKELSWENSIDLIENQIFIFAEQFRRQFRLLGNVDYIITDSPLILSSVYFDVHLKKPNSKFAQQFSSKMHDSCKEFFAKVNDEFDNMTFFIERNTKWSPIGRNESLPEAIAIDEKIKQMVSGSYISIDTLPHEVVKTILNKILE